VFGLAALVQNRADGTRARNVCDSAAFSLSFLVVVVLGYLLYADALGAFASVASVGVTAYRNSVYAFLDVFTVYLLPGFFNVSQSVALYQNNVGAFLRGAYIALYGVVLLAFAGRLRRDTFNGVAEACLAVTVLYFLLVNTSNQEWYLTWWMGLALVLPFARARSLAWWLSACFLAPVIFTVKNPAPIWFVANVVLYCLIAGLGIRYLTALSRAIRSGDENLPAS
jgi:hypothetical protein